MENKKTPPDSNDEELSPTGSEEANSVEISGQGSIGIGGEVNQSNVVSGKDNITGNSNTVNNTTINNNYYDSSSSRSSSKVGDRNYLPRISVDGEAIRNINSYLSVVHKAVEDSLLSKKDEDEFDSVKADIATLKIDELNSNLKKIASQAKGLFDICKKELSEKRGLELLNDDSLECIEQYLKILEQLQIELEEASELADWLYDNRKRMAKKYGREAIALFPDVKSQISQETVKAFCFSVSQFLEQIAHCLRWGRSNILDAPEIPLELDIAVYVKAFRLAQKDLPPHISEEAKSQFDEYTDYLVERLPFYD